MTSIITKGLIFILLIGTSTGMKGFLQQRKRVRRKNRAHFCVEIQEPPYFDPDADTMATPFLMCPNNMQPDIFCRCLAENIYAPLSDFLEMCPN